MKIRYNVNVPEDYDFRGGKWSDLLKDFAQKNYRNQEIQFESSDEANIHSKSKKEAVRYTQKGCKMKVIEVVVVEHKGKLIGLDTLDVERLMKKKDTFLNSLLGASISGLVFLAILIATH